MIYVPIFLDDWVVVALASCILFLSSGDRKLWGDRAANLLEWHHYYLGLLVLGLGVLVWPPGRTCSHGWCHENVAWLRVTGICMMTDDAVQHYLQASVAPAFISPMHHLFAWVYGWCWPLRALERLLDRLMGKR